MTSRAYAASVRRARLSSTCAGGVWKHRLKVVRNRGTRLSHHTPRDPRPDVTDRVRNTAWKHGDPATGGAEDEAVVQPVERPSSGHDRGAIRGRRGCRLTHGIKSAQESDRYTARKQVRVVSRTGRSLLRWPV